MEELYFFGIRMKELRTIKKLSQEQLAAKIEISSKYMSRIEMGLHFPSFTVLTKLANALNIELKDLFEFAHMAKNVRELRKSIIEMLNNANEENLRLIFRLLRTMLI